MKAVVAVFNQEKALVGAFSVIVKTGCETDGSFHSTNRDISQIQQQSNNEVCILHPLPVFTQDDYLPAISIMTLPLPRC